MANSEKQTEVRQRGKTSLKIWKKWWFWVIVVVLLGAIGTGNSSDSTTEPETETVAESEETKDPTPTQTTTEQKEPEPTQATEEMAPTQATEEQTNTEPQEKNDLDIITREGHPTYYGDIEQAHFVWDNVEKGKILFPDNYHDKYSDSTMLVIGLGASKKDIRKLEIYFENMENNTDITLDTAISVLEEYLPYDIIEKWYEFNKSYRIVANDEDNEMYYVVSYSLKEEYAYSKENEHSYSGSVDVIIKINEKGNADYLTIGFGVPRWMMSLDTNGYSSEEWYYNLLDSNKFDIQ